MGYIKYMFIEGVENTWKTLLKGNCVIQELIKY